MLSHSECQALLELVKSSINSSSEHKGATLLHVRDTLEEAVSGGCPDCGEITRESGLLCDACLAGRLNV